MQIRHFLKPVLTGIITLSAVHAQGATYTWGTTSGFWGTGTAWQGGASPTGTNPADILIFGGDVGTSAVPTTYISTNNIPATPFLLNELRFTATDSSPAVSGLSHSVNGSVLRFAGPAPSITHQGTANIILDTPVQIGGTLTIGGTGTGRITANNAFSGLGDITKSGPAEFRFGTFGIGAAGNASGNTWMGKFTIQEGTVRFNNNAQAGATALRANPVEFTGNATLSMKRDGGDESNDYDSSLRVGTLMGNTGTVLTQLEDANTSNFDIVVTALTNGTFGGSITIPAPTGIGNDGGALTIRGTATQTLTGTLNIYKDVVVGNGATLTLGGTATLATYSGIPQTRGAITMAGGTVILDNTTSNIPVSGRLRDGNATSTTVESIGGGTLRLIGNNLGTIETTGRLQLGALTTAIFPNETKPRSGLLNIEVVHNAGGSAPTELNFQSYVRDSQTLAQLSTVNFAATNAAGNALTLGSAGNNPRIRLAAVGSTPPLTNGLLSTTTAGNLNPSIGWATVNGTSFAGYDATNGVIAVPTVNWTTNLSAASNALITGSAAAPAANYIINSVKIQPTAAGQALTLPGTGAPAGHLVSTAFLLAGAIDYAINATNSAGIAGNSPRFFHVSEANLTVNVRMDVTQQAIVKSGEGTLTLTHASNANLINDSAILAINAGAVRATPGSSLPSGELRFRGGQLEVVGGGTFSRQLGFGPFSVNWSGVVSDGLGGNMVVDEDRGTGGFGAIGADVTLDLVPDGGQNLISWEDVGFVRSGYALVFGSRSSTNKVIWTDNLSLSEANANTSNYNARDIRVLDNTATEGDWARISGTISGRVTNDLLKTGPGKLELTGTNAYLGATLIKDGELFVNGINSASFLHDVSSGATLAGNGTVGDVRVGAGGMLAPGIDTGLASILNTEDLVCIDGTSRILMDIGGTTVGGDTAAGYDRLSVTGSVILGGADLVLTLTNGFVPTPGTTFFLLLNDGADAITGQFSDGALTMAGAHPFSISYTANSANGQMTGGNDIAVQYIPEPSSALLLGLGAITLARRRRKAD